MRIIRAGDLRRCALLVRFECADCGCVFEAGPHEYIWERDARLARCPCCYAQCAGTQDKEG